MYAYCRYCVTELRGNLYRRVGICNYCYHDSKRRRVYGLVENNNPRPTTQNFSLGSESKTTEDLKTEWEERRKAKLKQLEELKKKTDEILYPNESSEERFNRVMAEAKEQSRQAEIKTKECLEKLKEFQEDLNKSNATNQKSTEHHKRPRRYKMTRPPKSTM